MSRQEYRAVELMKLIRKLNDTGVVQCQLPEPGEITEISDDDT